MGTRALPGAGLCQAGLYARRQSGQQTVSSRLLLSSRCPVSAQPTSEKPSGVQSSRLMAALLRFQARGACSSCLVGQPVQDVHHATMGHQHDLATDVLRAASADAVFCTRSRMVLSDSPPGGGPSGSRLRHCNDMSGQSASISAWVLPSNSPKPRSRKPWSVITGQAAGFFGNRLSGLPGAHQVAGVNGIDRLVSQRQRNPTGLPQTHIVERDVQMPLKAGVRVEQFAVAVGDDAGNLPSAECPV